MTEKQILTVGTSSPWDRYGEGEEQPKRLSRGRIVVLVLSALVLGGVGWYQLMQLLAKAQ